MKVSSVKKLNHIPMILVFSMVTLLGITFLILSFGILKQDIPENYVETEATIVDIIEGESVFEDETTYDVFIEYSFGENKYENREYNKYSSSMKIGDKVKIYVNPDSWEEFVSDNSDAFIFPIISGVFTIIGVVGIIYNAKKLAELKRKVQ